MHLVFHSSNKRVYQEKTRWAMLTILQKRAWKDFLVWLLVWSWAVDVIVVAAAVAEAAEELPTSTTIAFGSCHKNRGATVPSIWEQIVNEIPDAFVWTGDAMYPPNRDPVTRKKRYGPASPTLLQEGFDAMKVNTTIGYTKVLETKIPIYGTWDDHDYGGNDMGKYMPDRQERQTVFWNFLGYRPHEHDGVYHSVDIQDKGHIKLILLDTRWFRDNHCIPTVAHKLPMGNAIACATRWATAGLNLWKYASWWGMEGCDNAELLGNEQWNWLQEELLSSKADLNIIVSSIQIWTTNPAMESWGQFPKEQERLWNLLKDHYAKQSVGPVVFWSGDVHHGEISGHPGYLEVTSSGMTHHCGQPKLYGQLCRPILENFKEHRWKESSFYVGLNYGVLQVDWQTRVATVQIKSAQGETVLQVEQSLDIGTIELPRYEDLPHTWNGHLIPWLVRILVTLFVVIIFARNLLLSSSR